MKKKSRRCSRRSQPLPQSPEELRAQIESLSNRCQGLWHNEITSEAPNWGTALGLHVRLSELEYLEASVEELL